MTARFTESVVEEATLAWLEGLGYTFLHIPELAPGEYVIVFICRWLQGKLD